MQKWCKACVLLDGLNRGLPKLGIGRSRGLDSDHTKDTRETNGTKSLESKQCGSLDFWCTSAVWQVLNPHSESGAERGCNSQWRTRWICKFSSCLGSLSLNTFRANHIYLALHVQALFRILWLMSFCFNWREHV